MGRASGIYINETYCKGCGLCIDTCPQDILELSAELNAKGVYPAQVTNLDECTACKLCEFYCPDFAIAVELRGETVASASR